MKTYFSRAMGQHFLNLQAGAPYGLFRDLLSNDAWSKASLRDRKSLQWSLYDFSIYDQILNVNC